MCNRLIRWLFRRRIKQIEDREKDLGIRESEIAASLELLRQRHQEAGNLLSKLQEYLRQARLGEAIDVCRSKVVYQSRESAQYASLALYYKDGRRTVEYKCSVCPFWHLSHAKKNPVLFSTDDLVTRQPQDGTSLQELARFKGGTIQDLLEG